MHKLKYKSLTKEFNGNEIWHDISLELGSNEFIFIKGRSGSGKSTLLNIIGLLDRPTEGDIFLNDSDVGKFSDDKLSELRNRLFGFIFQSYHLIPHLTVYENVSLSGIINKTFKTQNQLDKKIFDCLKIVGLEDKIYQTTNLLSGGEQQRVAIARAILNNPQFIIADEPTGNLDPENEKKVIMILKMMQNLGKTIVVVSHNPIYKQYCTKEYILENNTLNHIIN